MPCSDSSSSMVFRLDRDERFISFQYAKITCGSEIAGSTGLSKYLQGKSLKDILETPFEMIAKNLNIKDEEGQFILYMEWDVLKSAIAEYLGSEGSCVDHERCKITSIDQSENEIEVALVVLPPRELPKILPCSLGDKSVQ